MEDPGLGFIPLRWSAEPPESSSSPPTSSHNIWTEETHTCEPGQLVSQVFLLGAHLLKTPSTPVMPMPSTMSLVSLKGTVSGVGRVFPCSNATPEGKNGKACRGRFVGSPGVGGNEAYLNRCAPARRSARRSGCSGRVCHPDPRCSPLRTTRAGPGDQHLPSTQRAAPEHLGVPMEEVATLRV